MLETSEPLSASMVHAERHNPAGFSMDPCDHSEVAPNQIINPKEIAGSKKPAIWKVMPRWIVLLAGRVMTVGAAKYGIFNYRDSKVSAMTYVDAIERHMQLWQDGEDDDDETGVSHLAHIIAGCAILLDAQANGSLGDDRPVIGMVRKTLEFLSGGLNARLARILRDGD